MSMKETYGHMLYPSYKPTGTPWLGDVPDHWATERLKQHVDDVNEQTRERLSQDIYIALENVEGWTGKITAAENEVSFDSQVKRFQVGDVLFGKLRPYLAKVAAPNRKGLCVGEFLVLRSQQDSLSPDYLEQLLRSKGVIDTVDASTFGAKMPRADWNFIGSMLFPIPPMDEQLAIVRYLDDANQRIRAYVSAKERLIVLLEEERQAVIHEAVTRGLDPNMKLKPSGVEWLGDVPEHWQILRLGSLATKFGSGITPRGGASVYQETGIPFLRSQNIHFDGLRLTDVARISPSLHQELASSHVKSGDVLLNITGASIGRVSTVPPGFEEGNVNQHVCIIRPKQNLLLSELLSAYLSTPMMQQEIQSAQSGASREGLTLQSIRDFKVIIPPIAEQQAMVKHFESETAKTYAALDHARRQIELMEEYRARLIADVVTGKLDVREAKP